MRLIQLVFFLFFAHSTWGLDLDPNRNNATFLLSNTRSKAMEISSRFYFIFDEWPEGKLVHELKSSWFDLYNIWERLPGECTPTSPCTEINQGLQRFISDTHRVEKILKDPWQKKLVSQIMEDTKKLTDDLHLKMALSFGKLDPTFWREKLEQLDDQICALLLHTVPPAYRRHFRVGFILFERKLEKHLVRNKNWAFLYPELQDLNQNWNEFNVSLTKRSLSLTSVTLGRLDDVHNHWNSILKDLLKF